MIIGEIKYNITRAREVGIALSRLSIGGAGEIDAITRDLRNVTDLLKRVHEGGGLSKAEKAFLESLREGEA